MPRWPAKETKTDCICSNPTAIIIPYPYSFLDEDGVHFVWPANKKLTNRHSIAMLLERGIPFEVVKEDR